jgi:hypothetical protein
MRITPETTLVVLATIRIRVATGLLTLDWQHRRDHPPARLARVSVLVGRVRDCLAFLVCRQLRAGDSR